VLRDLGGVGHAQRLQLIARERGDRDRHLGDVLGPLGGGHHDIAETAGRVLWRFALPAIAVPVMPAIATAMARCSTPLWFSRRSCRMLLIAGTNWCFC
jgi:hypothetical protein